MHISNLFLSLYLPAAYAQLDTLAKAAVSIICPPFSSKVDHTQGLKYFGTATDNPSNDPAYTSALSNASDFGQLTPANAQKVCWQSYINRRRLTGCSGMRLNL